MPRKVKTAAANGKAALPQLSAQMLEELIPGPVTKEQFEDILGKKLRAVDKLHRIGTVPIRTYKDSSKGTKAKNRFSCKPNGAAKGRTTCAPSAAQSRSSGGLGH